MITKFNLWKFANFKNSVSLSYWFLQWNTSYNFTTSWTNVSNTFISLNPTKKNLQYYWLELQLTWVNCSGWNVQFISGNATTTTTGFITSNISINWSWNIVFDLLTWNATWTSLKIAVFVNWIQYFSTKNITWLT